MKQRLQHTLDFAASDGGKNANYLLRWVNSTGQKSTWSGAGTLTVEA